MSFITATGTVSEPMLTVTDTLAHRCLDVIRASPGIDQVGIAQRFPELDSDLIYGAVQRLIEMDIVGFSRGVGSE